MNFKFYLFVQKHQGGFYTVAALPFNDVVAYGANLDTVKAEIAESLKEKVAEMPVAALHKLEFVPGLTMQHVTVEIRPVDRRTKKKRRDQVKITFSLLVRKEEDGQLFVTVPRLGSPPLSFYVYSQEELQAQAQQEIAAVLGDATLEDLTDLKPARSEYLETLEIEIPIKKAKERAASALSDILGSSRKEDNDLSVLQEVGLSMTAQEGEGRLRKAYRRESHVEDILQVLSQPRNNCVLLVGQSEVGKTAIVHEVVRRIAKKTCPEALHGREVWMLTPDRLIAGAQFIGTWEERIMAIANACRNKGVILYIEDLPGLLEAGRWSKSDTNIGMALKPHIASGHMVIIGECSPERLLMGQNLGSGLINLFKIVRVDPFAQDEAYAVLASVARDLERTHDIRIDPSALDSAIELTRRFLPYRAFPGKGIRLLEDAAAEIARKTATHEGDGIASRRFTPRQTLTRAGVIGHFSHLTGLPEFIINDDSRLELDGAETFFQERVMGQPQALQAMINLIVTVKAGLNDPKKPLGSFLFIGPTGVGKTEMAKTLAAYLFGDPARMIRFDMSEYSSGDGAVRLIGTLNAEGELTCKVREQPFCVVLLDEFEKAESRIYDIFLQVLGEGRLTDANGKTTYFHNTILIMTSNLGAGQREMRKTGFNVPEAADAEGKSLDLHYRQHVESYFRPEFVNRIDQIVVFGHLAPDALRQIAARELTEVLTRDGIARRNALVEIDESVIRLVLEKGYSPVYGARPLKREIERLVVTPLARMLAAAPQRESQLLRVVAEGAGVTIRSLPITEAEQTATVSLSSGNGSRQRMDTPALVEALAALRRKLADWNASDTVKEMREEKTNLMAQTQRPDFWKRADEARETLARYYFLDRLLQRIEGLRERAEYLEDFGIMISRERAYGYQTDLARDYEKLYHQVSYLDVELMTAHLPHRNQAMMLITGLGDQTHPPEDAHAAWPRRMAELYLRFAERKGYELHIYLLKPALNAPGGMAFHRLLAPDFPTLRAELAAQPPTAEIALYLQGTNVFGFLKGERGVHKRVGREGMADELAYVRVYACPDDTEITRWLDDYQLVKTEIAEGTRTAPAQEKLTVIRLYSLDREKFIRDLRTAIKLTNVKEVMERGLLDEMILAYLQTPDAQITWEDRYPATFPY
jgi:ATP-dependent Clp protease ATP-binding subunit ClpC